ncbi:hypothetical protein [Endozoicomonas lisbonensis]|uniref:Baseplate protein J-like domain-containing protein n=1 Tax=Endozoicomonas lisbonensis TaxID=3120522 RepID=A0ABV2SP72_9GAMM
MDFYESKEQTRAEFIELVRQRPQLAALADSQLLQAMNTHQNLAIEAAFRKLERTRQEQYLSTCVNRSSTLAHSEDRLYTPRKPTPSSGMIRVLNRSEFEQGLPDLTKVVDEQQRPYLLTEPVIIEAGEEADVPALQLDYTDQLYLVEEQKPFFEILLPRELSPKVSELSVFVDSGAGLEEWEYRPMFRNSGAEDHVYDEFYNHLEQIGIRFGNGLFGRMPPANASIKVVMWITEGETSLMPSQKLSPVAAVARGVEFESADTITGGRNVESTDDIARNAQYNVLYDDSVIWSDDFEFFIRRHHPGILWLKVWGEQEMEEMVGHFDMAHINNIFVCCYDPADPDVSTKVKESLDSLPRLNRKYTLYEREDIDYVVAITGRLKRSVGLKTARQMISDCLVKYYGKDASWKERKSVCLIRDLYPLMNDLDIFANQEELYIDLEGMTEPEKLNQMVFIDLDESMNRLTLTY